MLRWGYRLKFDRHQLDKWLQTIADDVPPVFKIHLFDTVPSTNQTLWELVSQGGSEGTVAIALQQQAGRGQWGRQWQSLPGGLYLSLALTPNLASENGGQLTLISAWGIASALRHYKVPVELKWPNDLVVQGRKLGGILTETRIAQGLIYKAIVGVGINWANPVPEMGINLQTVLQAEAVERSQPLTIPLDVALPDATALKITSLEMLGAIVLDGMMNAYRQWQNQGIEAILPRYHQLLTSIGHPVKVNNDLGTVTGVSATGDLRVSLQNLEVSSAIAELCVKPGTVRLEYVSFQREPGDVD